MSTTESQGNRPRASSSPRAWALAEREWNVLLDGAPDAVVICDESGTIVLVNEQAERLLGYDREELVGRPVETLLPESVRERHESERAAYVRAPRARPMGAGLPLLARRKDGTETPVEISLSPLETSWGRMVFSVIRDVRDRDRVEAELEFFKRLTLAISRAEDLGSALIAAIREVCESAEFEGGEAWLPDESRTALSLVASWSRGGSGVKALVGETEARFAPGEGLPGRVWRTGRAEVSADIGQVGLSQFTRRDRAVEAGVVGAMCIPISEGGRVAAVMSFYADRPMERNAKLIGKVLAATSALGPVIAGRRNENRLRVYQTELETLVRERTAELKESHERMRQADRMATVGALAAGLGHDMNNTLLPVSCRLDMMEAELARDRGSASLRESVGVIRQSMDYLRRLTDGLRLLAMDPESTEPGEGSTDIAGWWIQAEPMLRETLAQRARLEASIEAGLPRVRPAPHKLMQAVLNLVVNAGDAISQAGRDDGVVHVRAVAGRAGTEVHLSVRDNGVGMSEQVRQRALDPFFTTKPRGLGTGMGLAMVQGIVGGVGGRVAIRSVEGAGTTVRLALPVGVGGTSESGCPIAAVSVPDSRARSLYAALLRGAGAGEVVVGEDDRATLWVVDLASTPREDIERYMRGDPRRRAVAVGESEPGDEAWPDGITRVRDGSDFERMRDAIGSAMSTVTGGRG